MVVWFGFELNGDGRIEVVLMVVVNTVVRKKFVQTIP